MLPGPVGSGPFGGMLGDVFGFPRSAAPSTIGGRAPPGRRTLDALADLVLPATCAGCDVPASLLCVGCAAAVGGAARARTPAVPGERLPPTYSVADYTGVVRVAVLAYKDRGRRGLAAPFGAALACGVRAALPDGPVPVLLVPVPSSASAVRRRGDDPVRRLAATAAALLRADGWPASYSPALRLRRRVADQSGLPAAARATNLHGAHEVPRRWRAAASETCVVVDDVVTTGSTLAEAARALTAAGQPPVAAATVAATVLARPGWGRSGSWGRSGPSSHGPPALHVGDGSD